MGKKARAIDPNNREISENDRVIAANPPRITWRRKPNGVWVHTSIRDPHAESVSHQELMDRIDRREAEEARRLQLMQEEGRRVAARFEKHRADNTSLMRAARTEL